MPKFKILREVDYKLLYDNEVSKENIYKLTKLKDGKKLEEGKKLSILSDSMFKTMIYNDSRIKYSAKLLSYFINIDYARLLNSLKLDKSHFNKDKNDSKGEVGDYVASIKGISFNIEVNCNDDIYTLRRNMDYAYRLYAKDIKVGKSYHNFNRVIQLNINNFSFNGNDNTVDYYLPRCDSNNLVLDDSIIFIQIYIPNLLKKWYTYGNEGLTDYEKYLLVLIHEDTSQLEKMKGFDEVMEEFINDAVYASHNDDNLLRSYDKEQAMREQEHRDGFDEGQASGFDEGHKSGFDEGHNNAKIEVAKKMLDKGMNTHDISEITGLSIDKINNLSTKKQS